MFGLFGRKKKREATTDTFLEATGGGWGGDPPRVIAGNGGSQADYVGHTLHLAREQALADGVKIGQSFDFS